MNRSQLDDVWWKNAVIYCLDVETYFDSNGDGCGDLEGLTSKLDHLADLGVTCLWLMPFYPTANRDDGYDVTEYYGVDPRLGSLGDAVVFLRSARERGMRVIVDLVVNHTSDEHPWFRSSRQDPDSPHRDWYVWRDEPAGLPDQQPVFPDAEDAIWSFDDTAGQYYLHHFYSHQPDLNIVSPAVRDEISRIAGFWLELGVDGFRVDAVPFLFETGGVAGAVDLEPHEMLKDLRAFISRRRGDAMLLGEVNLPPDQLSAYFGDTGTDEIHMLFNFPVMQRFYLAMARQQVAPLVEVLTDMPDIPDVAQWANFVRNHDELTLDQLTDAEREEVFAAFGPDDGMQLFGRGIRRRLPPMLDGDPDRVRMAYSLMMTLPGSPVLYYGEEIGMGENLDIEGRSSVRTPMQWAPTAGGGFSESDDPIRPAPGGPYGPDAVNVLDQQSDADSLLSWMKRAIRCRRATPTFGWGSLEILDTDHESVLAHSLVDEVGRVLAVHNFGPHAMDVQIALTLDGGSLEDILDPDAVAPGVGEGTVTVPIGRYGHRWLLVSGSGPDRGSSQP